VTESVAAADAALPLPCVGSAHLELMLVEFDELASRARAAAQRLADTDAAALAALIAAEREQTVAATLALDGALTAGATHDEASAVDGSDAERIGTWLDALGGTVRRATGAEGDGARGDAVDEAEVTRLRDLEHRGVLAALEATDLADGLSADGQDPAGLGGTIIALHARLTAGLISAERAGALRRGPRVVHDASVGRIIFFPTDPELLATAWDGLLRDATRALRRPAPVRAALLHLELLRHHPFDAANGRLARAVHDHALRAASILPPGLAAADPVLATDPLGYLDGVAASMRRRDATVWIERSLESTGRALRRTLDAIAAPQRAAHDNASPLPDDLPATFTLADVVEATGCTASDARAVTSRWVIDGAAERVIGSSGLRLTRR
jgi:hypothetical protein